MEKMFAWVATFAVALMMATAGLGLWIGDLHGQTDAAILRWGTVHRLSGVLAALVVVLVNSMSVTYFIGTGRWCREVVETYSLPASFIARSKQIKRASFPFALIGMLKLSRELGAGVLKAMWQGFRDGRRAAWLPAQEWESLLERPLDEVRQQLHIERPDTYREILKLHMASA